MLLHFMSAFLLVPYGPLDSTYDVIFKAELGPIDVNQSKPNYGIKFESPSSNFW